MGSTPSLLSASRGAAILGLSNFNTQASTWLKIMEDRNPGFCTANACEAPVHTESVIFDMGHAFEDSVIELAELTRGKKIIDPERFYKHEDLPFVTCHIDGRYDVWPGVLHEGKHTTSSIFHEKWGDPGVDGLVPVDYQIQVQHQMACTGAEAAIISVLVLPIRQTEFIRVPNAEQALNMAHVFNEMGLFHQYEIARDDDKIKEMLEAYTEFWNKNILEQVPPDPANYADIRKLFKAPKGTVVASEEIELLSDEYKQITQEVKQIDSRKDQIKKMIIDYGREEGLKNGFDIDDDTAEKMKIVNSRGHKLHTFGKKGFR